jgi:hypothetical protein
MLCITRKRRPGRSGQWVPAVKSKSDFDHVARPCFPSVSVRAALHQLVPAYITFPVLGLWPILLSIVSIESYDATLVAVGAATVHTLRICGPSAFAWVQAGYCTDVYPNTRIDCI